MSRAYAGAVAPEAYYVDLDPGVSGIDLTTVTAAVLLVRKPDGTEVTWTVTQTNKTSTTLRLTHAYVAGDIPIAGDYRVLASLTVPSGTVRGVPQRLRVSGKFDDP